MSKYRALFIEESREHLAALSRLLVELETAEDLVPLVEDVFRRVHSIKGMAASMGYGPIATLAHTMEDLASGWRGTTTVAQTTVDILLRGVDALVTQVEAVAAETQVLDASEVVAEIQAAAAGKPEPPPLGSKKKKKAKKKKTTKKKGTKAKADAAGTESSARGTQRSVRVTLDGECKVPAVRLFMVHRQLSTLGEIVASTPSIEAIRAGQVSEHQAELVMLTNAEDEQLRAVAAAVSEVEAVEVGAAEGLPQAIEPAVAEPGADALAEQPAKAASVRVRTDVLDTLIDDVGELFILRERLENVLAATPRPEVRAVLDELSKAIREVHGQVMTVRMTPVRNLTDRYPRLVRDLGRNLDKEVELEVEGADIELDRAILENLDEPFVHTLRNAVDHGLEAPEDRRAAGKRPAGKLRISASRDRDTVVVVIEDDGRGLDIDALRAHAVRQGLITEVQADNLSARECYFLVCLPGFSTKAEVSDVSGRGVGMDAVRARIEAIGGTLDIESVLGAGTRFIFRLPLTVAIINVLLVESSRRVFALPVAKVVAVRDAGEDLIQEAGGGTYLSFRHALAPVYNLANLLHLDAGQAPEHAVVIEDGRDLVAIAVERVVGSHEVVVKPLGDPLDRMEWFSGATILGDGEPILILDLPKALRSRRAA